MRIDLITSWQREASQVMRVHIAENRLHRAETPALEQAFLAAVDSQQGSSQAR